MNKKQRNRRKRQKEQKLRTDIKPVETKPAPAGRPHALTITLTALGLLLACIALYWNMAQPDIRYVASLGPETMTVLETKFDSAGNFVHSVRMRPTFTNFSLKPGFIDRAELGSRPVNPRKQASVHDDDGLVTDRVKAA